MKTFTMTAANRRRPGGNRPGIGRRGCSGPLGGSSASDAVSSLQAQGYNVVLNGSVTAPLSDCTVTGVHGDSAGPVDPTRLNTVYVDVSCPSLND